MSFFHLADFVWMRKNNLCMYVCMHVCPISCSKAKQEPKWVHVYMYVCRKSCALIGMHISRNNYTHTLLLLRTRTQLYQAFMCAHTCRLQHLSNLFQTRHYISKRHFKSISNTAPHLTTRFQIYFKHRPAISSIIQTRHHTSARPSKSILACSNSLPAPFSAWCRSSRSLWATEARSSAWDRRTNRSADCASLSAASARMMSVSCSNDWFSCGDVCVCVCVCIYLIFCINGGYLDANLFVNLVGLVQINCLNHWLYVHVPACMHACMNTYKRADMHTYIPYHTYRSYIHTYIHT